MGSPEIAVTALEKLIETGHEIVCVYTQPPRAAGRGRKLTPTPVHIYAEARGLPIRTPHTLKSAEEKTAFQALQADLAIVVAYGLILPKAVLSAPKYGCVNLHASLLPRWRGAAPIQRAIMAGDKRTGIQAMMMEAGLDTGPVLASAETDIGRQETSGSLYARLSRLGADLLPDVIDSLIAGMSNPHVQSQAGISYAEKITAADQPIDWTRPANEIDAQIRGLSPAPGAKLIYTPQDASRPTVLKVFMSEVCAGEGVPGTVLDDKLTIACGEGAIRLKILQRPGKGPMSAEAFVKGVAIREGTRFT
mgnify:CR=1 FL=1